MSKRSDPRLLESLEVQTTQALLTHAPGFPFLCPQPLTWLFRCYTQSHSLVSLFYSWTGGAESQQCRKMLPLMPLSELASGKSCTLLQ